MGRFANVNTLNANDKLEANHLGMVDMFTLVILSIEMFFVRILLLLIFRITFFCYCMNAIVFSIALSIQPWSSSIDENKETWIKLDNPLLIDTSRLVRRVFTPTLMDIAGTEINR